MQYISQINFKDDANIDVTYLITLRSFRTQDILDFAIREKKRMICNFGPESTNL